MRNDPFSVQPGAALLLGFLLFTLRLSELAALLTAAAVHELGHLVCLRWLHIPIYGFSVSLSGPVLHCGNPNSRIGQVMAPLSGPFAGILFWIAFRPIWQLCAELSLFLSLINLLPILPLDGGRTLLAVIQDRKILFLFGFVSAFAMAAFGLYVFGRGGGLGILLFGLWLMMLSCQGSENDVK